MYQLGINNEAGTMVHEDLHLPSPRSHTNSTESW
jgi:hypothetical protein